MPARRNAYIVSSPEEEDEEYEAQTPTLQSGSATCPTTNSINLQDMTLNSTTTTTSSLPRRPSLSPIPLDISSSDDEERGGEVDVNNNYPEVPAFGIFKSLGLNLKREWFERCMVGLDGLDDSGKAKICFRHFLNADLNVCGAGVLPPNVKGLHLVELEGPFILQVDEIVNISFPLRTRYQKAAPGIKRCLKLSRTDGVQRVFGMEYRPIGALDVFAPAGMKVAISNVCVRHGLLMLVPEVIVVLGGVLEELEAARERLVQEVNKPPRGKRTRLGVVPPLADRATLAAWRQGNAGYLQQFTHNWTRKLGPGSKLMAWLVDVVPYNWIILVNMLGFHSTFRGVVGENAYGAPESVRPREHTTQPNNQETETTSFSASTLNGATLHTPASHALARDGLREHTAFQSHQEARTTSFSPALNGSALHTPASRGLASDRARKHTAHQSHQETVTTSFSASARNVDALHTPASHALASDSAREHTTHQSHKEAVTTSFSASALNGAVLHTPASRSLASDSARQRTASQSHQDAGDASYTPIHRMTEDTTPSSRRHSMDTNYLAEPMDVEEIDMADEIDFPYILNGEREIPFTYLASLSAKWALMNGKVRHVQGMIKCVTIGVKRFHFKGTDKYELQLYVDDGSLISEILIDHNLVERLIGHPPRAIAAGMVSSDEALVNNMKKKLMQFQSFLQNFEGLMLIQLNDAFPLPLAMEMKEGCTVSDAWKLLGRLKPSTSTRQPQHTQFNPIELSP